MPIEIDLKSMFYLAETGSSLDRFSCKDGFPYHLLSVLKLEFTNLVILLSNFYFLFLHSKHLKTNPVVIRTERHQRWRSGVGDYGERTRVGATGHIGPVQGAVDSDAFGGVDAHIARHG